MFVALMLVAALGLAHGDKKHIIGTVERITGDSVVVKSSAGNSVEVKLVAATVYFAHAANQDKPAQLSDLVVGDRVVIHATLKGETLEANEIRFSTQGSARTNAKP
jgi:preprotein translocase subunit YajC